MGKKILLLVLVLSTAVLLWYVFSAVKTEVEQKKALDSLTFDTTQTLDPYFDAVQASLTPWSSEQRAAISLSPPHKNSSDFVASELQDLHELSKQRTEEKNTEINQEKDIETAVFGTEIFNTFINPNIRPHTFELITYSRHVTDPLLLSEKIKYNRVRPSYIDPTLTTVLDVPNHPAYPSGHSTQAHLYAHIVGKLNPQLTDAYFSSAERIAKNREIAGLHYKSDSDAGKLLASQLYALLLTDPEFIQLFARAEQEWN